MTKIVKVTQKHIDNGERYAVDSCPIALALKDAGYNTDGVGWFSYIVFSQANYAEYKLPASVLRFRQAFDSGNPVRPFNFKACSPRMRVHD